MKNAFFLIAVVIFLGGCGNAQDTPVVIPAQEPKNVPPVAVEQPTQPAPVVSEKPGMIVLQTRSKEQIAPNFPFDIELLDPQGDTVRSDRVLATGKPTVLLFWLTTCVPCGYEMKAIQEKYADWQQQADFNLYAISTDFQKNFHHFQKRLTDKQFPWRSYNDVHREFRQVMPGGLNGLPQTFLLDKNGQIVYHKRKYRSGDEDLLFAEILKLAKG